MKFWRSKTFFRYLLSYIFILCLPVLILLLTCGRAIINRNMESMMQQSASSLTRLSETFDQQLEQLIRVSYMIQNDSSLNPDAIGTDIVQARAATTKLMRYQSMAMIPSYLYLYRSGSAQVYTSSGMISPDKLFNQQYVYQNHTLQDFYDTMDAKDSVVTWESDLVTQFGGNTAEYLTMFVSVRTRGVSPQTRTIFLIPVSALPAIHPDNQESVFLLGRDGSLLASTGSVDYSLLSESPSGTTGSRRITVKNVEYYVSSAISRITGWTYAVLTPVSMLEAPLGQLRGTLVLGLLLVLLFGSLLASYFSVRHYRPLQHLTMKAEQLVQCDTVANEVDKVEHALDYLQSARNEYKATFDANRANLVHEGLLRLFFENGQDARRIVEDLEKNGVSLSMDAAYQVVLLFVTDTDTARFENQLRAALTLPDVGLEETQLFVNYRLPSQIAVLLPAMSQDELLMRLEALQEAIEGSGCCVSMGVSQACTPQCLHAAYQQSEQALACRLVRGKHCIVFHDQLETDQQGIAYPQKEMEELQWHLLQLDEQQTKQVLGRLVQSLGQSSLSMGTARMIGFDVLNTVIKSLYALGAPDSTGIAEKIDSLAAFRTIDELTHMLNELIEQACQSIRAMQTQQPDERLIQLQSYINEHCFEPTFSINTVSDHFELSPSNLSHYFKKNMGMSLSDYIQSRRKEEACQLLVTTQLSVQEIGERLGMMNVTSFIRSFKQQTGITPGQYRKMHTEA